MCVYSMIADHYRDKWIPPSNPVNPYTVPPYTPPNYPLPGPLTPSLPLPNPMPIQFTPQEVEEFRKDMKEMKKLLERAKEYDRRNGEPDCELEEKKKKLQELADSLGVPIEFP